MKLFSKLKALLCALSDRIWVNRCHCCGIRISRKEELCGVCLLEYESAKTRECGICGRILSACDCVTPYLKRNRVRHLYKALPYRSGNTDDAVHRMVMRLKRRRPMDTFRMCGREIAQAVRRGLRSTEGWVITYAPRSLTPRHSYGYDQAQILAKCVAKELGIPYASLLKRRAFSRGQRGLSAEERRENMKHAYRVRSPKKVMGARILLLDDIVTTGSTLASATELLYLSGAANVRGVCLCIAIRS